MQLLCLNFPLRDRSNKTCPCGCCEPTLTPTSRLCLAASRFAARASSSRRLGTMPDDQRCLNPSNPGRPAGQSANQANRTRLWSLHLSSDVIPSSDPGFLSAKVSRTEVCLHESTGALMRRLAATSKSQIVGVEHCGLFTSQAHFQERGNLALKTSCYAAGERALDTRDMCLLRLG